MSHRGRFPTEAKNVQTIGLAGSNQVRFEGQIPHGKNRHGRRVTMDVHPEQILAIADALRATSGHACCDHKFDHCDLATYENMLAKGLCEARVVEQARFKAGHAIWHLDNPDMPMPCRRGRGEVIDVDDTDVIDVKDAAPALEAGPTPCTACEGRRAAGFEGQCPACANERARNERRADTKDEDA